MTSIATVDAPSTFEDIDLIFDDLMTMQDGWAGESTYAPGDEIIDNTRSLINEIRSRTGTLFKNSMTWSNLNIAPNPRGTIDLTWYWSDGTDLSIEIGTNEAAGSTNHSSSNSYWRWRLEDKCPDEVIDLLSER